MKLSRTQRRICYIKLLDMVCKDSNTHFGFCYYVRELMYSKQTYRNKMFGYVMTEELIKNEFPELYSNKPNNLSVGDTYWFELNPEGWEKRIRKLNNIIQTM